MERVSNFGLELDLLAHTRSLYKGDFYYQKAEMNGRQTRKCLLKPSAMRILYKWMDFTCDPRDSMLCSSRTPLLGATTTHVS